MGNEKYGIHGLSEITDMILWNRFKPGLNGFRFRKGWKGFETSPDVFVYSYWKDQFNIVLAEPGKYISFISIVAPTSSNDTPAWDFNPPYNVPFITTDRGTYPYGLNPATFTASGSWAWLTRFKNHWDEFVPLISSYSSDDQLRFIVFQSGELSTGDAGTIKGTISSVTINGVIQPSPSLYNIPDSVWTAHKRTNLWPYGYALANSLPATNFMVNISNDLENLEWLLANLENAWAKLGYPAHSYNIPGEKFQAEAGDMVRSSPINYNRIQAEFEKTLQLAWFSDSPKQNIKAIFASACHHGVDIINIALNNLNTLFGSDLSLITWINQYLGYRDASETNKGFCVFRWMGDFSKDWSAITAEPLIDPAKLSAYNTKVATINGNANYGALQKKYKIAAEKIADLNPALVTALRAAFPLAAYHAPDQDQDQDAYNMDYGVDMIPDNYYRFNRQIDPDGTTSGVFRFGDTNGYDGRTGRKGPKFYMVTELLAASNYQVKIDVKYHDVDGIEWRINYSGGYTETVTNGTTGLIKNKTFVISDMDGGGTQAFGADYIVGSVDGIEEITLEQIDFTRVAENAGVNLPPIVIIDTPNTSITLPTNSVSVTSTIVDTDGIIASILWTHESGPMGSVISSPTTANTDFTSLPAGLHVFRVTATDDLASSSFDEIIITVNEEVTDTTPSVDLGPNKIITLPFNIVELEPVIDSSLAIAFVLLENINEIESGYTITDIHDPFTSIIFTAPGTYMFRQTIRNVNDEEGSDTITITVNPKPQNYSQNTGRYKAYRAKDVQLNQTGYLKAWLSLVTDFATLNNPVLSESPLIGEKYTISESHVWKNGFEAIPVYVKKDSIEAPGDSIGIPSLLRILFTPKIFIVGDGAEILEMVNNWMNEDLVLFIQDECSPSKFIQFGNDCGPASFIKPSFSSGTLKSGAKGFEITMESLTKFFYNGTISELI